MSQQVPSNPPDPPLNYSRRPWTILGRLSKAVREQNWFAVALELLIVVLGVVIGFQVTSWGQDSADRQREQSYLTEIRRDLLETETSLQMAIEAIGATRKATTSLIGASYVSDPVPRDSMALWLFEAQYISIPTYRTGTAQALIGTGDLYLIRNDSTRIALSRLVDDVRRMQEVQETLVSIILPHLEFMTMQTATTNLFIDVPVESLRVGEAYIEAHLQSIPASGQLSFAEDYMQLRGDVETFRRWRVFSDHLLVLQIHYRSILEIVQQTLVQVEADLGG